MNRVDEIDFLRAVFITLMVMFHLAYFADMHPFAKQVVYTFHMSGFLLISGYLSSDGSDSTPVAKRLSRIGWVFVPYAIMETGYTVMSAVLPVRERLGELSLMLIVDKVVLHPLGPYWYLHTLILCLLVRLCVGCLSRMLGFSGVVAVVLMWMAFYVLSAHVLALLSMPNAMYFLAGAVVRMSGLRFTDVFRRTWWAAVPAVLLCLDHSNLDRSTIGGTVICYSVISLCLSLFMHLRCRCRAVSLFLGRNTLPILLFSPIFTMAAKVLIPLFSYDPTGLLFMLVATSAALIGSIAIAIVMDNLHLSVWLCGRDRLIIH